MENFKALIGLNMFLNIGGIRLKKLLEHFDEPRDILKASPGELSAVCGIGERSARVVSSFRKEAVDEEIYLAERNKLKVIVWGSADYPVNLKFIPDPPIVLYVRGKIKKEDNFGIAVVGSRRASFYGLTCAEKISRELTERGVTVVSGLARGVDTSAHKGALKGGGRTIAVLGSGFGYIYPPENKRLVDEITCSGAVISEFPVNTAVRKQNFPRRNRIISGLSLGVVVVEAARNSGALITANFALEQGREVFALPGKIDSSTSLGTNELIQQGAKLLTGVKDIFEEFDFYTGGQRRVLPVKKSREDFSADDVGLSAHESKLLEVISAQAIHVDEIIERTDIASSRIHSLLLGLQLKKIIRELPGKRFIRIKDEK